MATKRTTPRKDFTQIALDVVRQATGDKPAPAENRMQKDAPKVAKSAPKKGRTQA